MTTPKTATFEVKELCGHIFVAHIASNRGFAVSALQATELIRLLECELLRRAAQKYARGSIHRKRGRPRKIKGHEPERIIVDDCTNSET